MKPANLLRWYPRAWRERYGEELLALIQDTLDEGRPTWRLRLGVIWGGLRERGHQAGRAVRAADKWRTGADRGAMFVAGAILPSVPEISRNRRLGARMADGGGLDGVLAAVALTGAVVLASGLTALPALIRFFRAGGWPKIRRRIMKAAGATVVAGGALAGLVRGSGSRSPAQLNTSWVFVLRLLATGLAIAVAIGLWAIAATATARHLTLVPRVRAAQLVLGAVTPIMVTVMLATLDLWWSATQSSPCGWSRAWSARPGERAAWQRIQRAVRRGRRLRAAASGRTTSTRPLSGHTAATGLDELGGGLAGGPVGADRARGLQQQRQVLPRQHRMSGPSSSATDEDSRGRATSCSMCGRATSAVPASLRGDMILGSPTIDSRREERPGFRSGRL